MTRSTISPPVPLDKFTVLAMGNDSAVALNASVPPPVLLVMLPLPRMLSTLPTLAPPAMSSVLALTAMVPVPAVPVVPETRSVPPSMDVPPV